MSTAGTVRLEVLLATCSDERYPPSNAVDPNPNTFFLTTGLYPQELVLGFKGATAANISRIRTLTHGVKKMRIEKSVELTPTKFEVLLECDPANPQDPSGAPHKQDEQFLVTKTTLGSAVRFLKVVLLSGYDHFAAVYDISVEGEPVAGSDAAPAS